MSLLNKDVLSGALFMLVGAAGLYLGADYAMGNAFRMGPGYFPRMLNFLLLLVGLIIAVKGLVVGGDRPERLHLRPLILVTLAVVVFGALIAGLHIPATSFTPAFATPPLGLLPAAAAVVLLGAAGGPEFRTIEGIVLAVLLTAAALGIFKFGLSMTMPILDLSPFGLPRY